MQKSTSRDSRLGSLPKCWERSWDSKKNASEHLTVSDRTSAADVLTCDWSDRMKQLRADLSGLKLHSSVRLFAECIEASVKTTTDNITE